MKLPPEPPDAPDEKLPEELPEVIPPPPEFDYELMPDAFRDLVKDAAERMQCPPDYLAVGLIVALSIVVGRQAIIHPKRYDDGWRVVPNLWGAVIGRPGAMKTPALEVALKPLKRLEIKAREVHKLAEDDYKKAALLYTEKEKKRKRDIREAHKKEDDELAAKIAGEHVDEAPERPTLKRYTTQDITEEKLGELLGVNPRGIGVFCDELMGWLTSLERDYNSSSSRAFYLTAWNGTGSHTIDRVTRPSVHIESACVSILGGIQPGPLMKYVTDAMTGGTSDDGLLQRFQLIVWPEDSKPWKNVDRKPCRRAKKKAWEVFERLDELDPESIGAETGEFGGEPFFRFSEEAQELFDKWREGLEPKVRSGDLQPAYEAHLTKYRSLIPSLALLFHLADNCRGRIDVRHVERAIAWGDYLEAHAKRIYAPVLDPALHLAKILLDRIKKGDLSRSFTERDVYRKGWRLLNDKKQVEMAIDYLLDTGHLSEKVTRAKETGRPKTIYTIHPSIKLPQECGEKN